MTQHQLLFIQIQFVKQEPHNIYIREAINKKNSKQSDIYQKGGVGSEFYENKFLFCNCDIRGWGRTLYDTISLR